MSSINETLAWKYFQNYVLYGIFNVFTYIPFKQILTYLSRFKRLLLCVWIVDSSWFGVKGLIFASILGRYEFPRGSENGFFSPSTRLDLKAVSLFPRLFLQSGLSGGTLSAFFERCNNVFGVWGVSKSLKARREGGEPGGVCLEDMRVLFGEHQDEDQDGLDSLEDGVKSSEFHSCVVSNDVERFKSSSVSSPIVENELVEFAGVNRVCTQSLTSSTR